MNSTLSLVKPRKQITHGVKKKKKSKDEILKEEERKLTYAQKRKQKASYISYPDIYHTISLVKSSLLF